MKARVVVLGAASVLAVVAVAAALGVLLLVTMGIP